MSEKRGKVSGRHMIAVDSITSVLLGKVGRNGLSAVGMEKGCERVGACADEGGDEIHVCVRE